MLLRCLFDTCTSLEIRGENLIADLTSCLKFNSHHCVGLSSTQAPSAQVANDLMKVMTVCFYVGVPEFSALHYADLPK